MPDFEGGISSLTAATRFVACFDVLGFKNLVSKTPIADLFEKYSDLARRAVHDNGTIILWDQPGGVLGGGVFRFPCLVFSDTLLLWCEDNASAATAFFSSCAYLLKASVELEMPLRGGIAYGETICDVRSGICLGQAVVDAYLTEQSQDWVGAALHSSCMQRRSWLDSVVAYQVPTKPGGFVLSHALTWHHYTVDAEQFLSKLEAKAPPNAKQKYSNALSFVRETRLQ